VHTGSATGTTASMQPGYQGSCGGDSAKDAVYSVTPSMAGTMNVNLGGSVQTPFDSVLYVRTACDDATTQIDCDDAMTKGDETLTLQVQAGIPYYIFVDGYGSYSGAYTINVKLNAPECGNLILDAGEQCDDGNTSNNDGCSSSCVLEAVNNDKCQGFPLPLVQSGANLVGTVNGNTSTLQPDFQGTCGSTSTGRDAVYQFNAGFGGVATATVTSAGYDSVVYARAACTGGAELACNDKTGNGLDTITFNVLPNTSYWVFVDGYSGEAGSFTLQVMVSPAVCGNNKVEGTEQCDDGNPTPGDGCSAQCMLEAPGPNDVCPGNALTLSQNGQQWLGSVTSSTINLTADYAGTCGSTNGARDAVYHFNSGPGGKTVATITAASFDSVIYARSGSCAGGTELACDDDASSNGGDTITFNTAPNTDIWLFVDGYGSKFGSFTLNVSVTPAVCGNTYLEGTEQCDDGNPTAGDGCFACAWEGTCGAMAEAEPNAYSTPQVIPAACRSFELSASMPQGDSDYFQIDLVAGQTLTASTFVGVPGSCAAGADTVLSLWNAPLTPTNESGACATAGYLKCNDTDDLNSPCASITHVAAATGTYILKVHDYFTTKSIASYGLYVTIH
jgi:cysteine-rich repeat protein